MGQTSISTEKLLKMKNYVLRKKAPFPKTIAQACYIFSKWKNQYSISTITKMNPTMLLTLQQRKEKKKSDKRK